MFYGFNTSCLQLFDVAFGIPSVVPPAQAEIVFAAPDPDLEFEFWDFDPMTGLFLGCDGETDKCYSHDGLGMVWVESVPVTNFEYIMISVSKNCFIRHPLLCTAQLL